MSTTDTATALQYQTRSKAGAPWRNLADRHACWEELQRQGMRHSEAEGLVQDLEAGQHLTADNWHEFRCVPATVLPALVATAQPWDKLYMRQGLLRGTTEGGAQFELDTSGATLLLQVQVDGQTVVLERADLRPLLEAWVFGALERAAL